MRTVKARLLFRAEAALALEAAAEDALDLVSLPVRSKKTQTAPKNTDLVHHTEFVGVELQRTSRIACLMCANFFAELKNLKS